MLPHFPRNLPYPENREFNPARDGSLPSGGGLNQPLLLGICPGLGQPTDHKIIPTQVILRQNGRADYWGKFVNVEMVRRGRLHPRNEARADSDNDGRGGAGELKLGQKSVSKLGAIANPVSLW